MGSLSVVILACMGLGMYLLYDRGYLAVQSKRAVMFIGSMGAGGNACHARFTACTGQIRRILRFRETGTVTFNLSSSLTKGSMSILVLDRRRNVLLALSPELPTGTLPAAEKERYHLLVRFDHADGEYRLDWK